MCCKTCDCWEESNSSYVPQKHTIKHFTLSCDARIVKFLASRDVGKFGRRYLFLPLFNSPFCVMETVKWLFVAHSLRDHRFNLTISENDL